jgi:hypothetical protein
MGGGPLECGTNGDIGVRYAFVCSDHIVSPIA